MLLDPLWASAVCEGLHAAGSRHVIYVPDNPLSHVLRVLGSTYPDVQTTVATREEEAFGIAAGMYLGGARPTVMLQSSGLGNSLNAITSLLVPYGIPVLMIVSMRGDEGEWNTAQMPMGRAVRHILHAIGVEHVTVMSADVASETTCRAGDVAFATRVSHACLLPKRLTAAPTPTATPTNAPTST